MPSAHCIVFHVTLPFDPCQSDLCFSIMETEAKGRFWSYILRLPDNEICHSFLCGTVFLPPSPSLTWITRFAAGEYLYMVMWTSQNGFSAFELTLTYCHYCAITPGVCNAYRYSVVYAQTSISLCTSVPCLTTLIFLKQLLKQAGN